MTERDLYEPPNHSPQSAGEETVAMKGSDHHPRFQELRGGVETKPKTLSRTPPTLNYS